MAFNFGIRTTGLERVLFRVKAYAGFELTAAEISELASLVETGIKTRTLAGEDFRGQRFAPYSEKYRKTREKAGRRVDLVNLFWSGKMLASMTHREEVGKQQARIFFATPEHAAMAHGHQTGRMGRTTPREFFRPSQGDIQKVRDRVAELLKRRKK